MFILQCFTNEEHFILVKSFSSFPLIFPFPFLSHIPSLPLPLPFYPHPSLSPIPSPQVCFFNLLYIESVWSGAYHIASSQSIIALSINAENWVFRLNQKKKPKNPTTSLISCLHSGKVTVCQIC